MRRRAVQKQYLVNLSQRSAYLQKPLGGLLVGIEMNVEFAIGKIRRQKIQAGVPGPDDQFGYVILAGEQFLCRSEFMLTGIHPKNVSRTRPAGRDPTTASAGRRSRTGKPD